MKQKKEKRVSPQSRRPTVISDCSACSVTVAQDSVRIDIDVIIFGASFDHHLRSYVELIYSTCQPAVVAPAQDSIGVITEAILRTSRLSPDIIYQHPTWAKNLERQRELFSSTSVSRAETTTLLIS